MAVHAKVIPIHKVEEPPEEVIVSPGFSVKRSSLRKGWHPPKVELRVGVSCKRHRGRCASWDHDHNCFGPSCPFKGRINSLDK